MKTSRVSLEDIAHWDNLTEAAWRAAQGKRERPEVARFLSNLNPELSRLAGDILGGGLELGQARRFTIHDPKTRVITAPCFRERVVHHALMRFVAPVLQRAMVPDSFACIPGRGTHKAVLRAQAHVRRFPWFVKMDIRQYFPSIAHEILSAALERKFRDSGVRSLIAQLVRAYPTAPGLGLPIGALTSQWFANYYLDPLDRFLLADTRVRGLVRYMDDSAFWTETSENAKALVPEIRKFLRANLRLNAHEKAPVQRSVHGVTICGYRVYPGALLLAQSRRRRLRAGLRRWESRWERGKVTDLEFQRGLDAVCGMTHGADVWRLGERIRVDSGAVVEEA